MFPHREKSTPWWIEAFAITRAVFGVLLWPLVAILGGMAVLTGLIIAFTAHWAWGLLVLLLIAIAVTAFIQWDKRRTH